MDYLTETQAKKLAKTSWKKSEPYALTPKLFSEEDDKLKFEEDMPLDIGLYHLGSYVVKSSTFKKIKCPICGKIELIPYSCDASIFMGVHFIKFHCMNCGENIAFNNIKDYYNEILNYCVKNRDHLKHSRKYSYPEAPKGVMIIQN